MSQFPASGELSMATIATDLGVPTNTPYSINDFRGKTLYNQDGSSYTISNTGELSIQSFYGLYYTNPRPPISPITIQYDNTGYEFSIPIPTGPERNPTCFTVQLYSGGGGGGGGSGAARAESANNNASGGGGGGGGSGGFQQINNMPYVSGMNIVGYVGAGGIFGTGTGGATSCSSEAQPGGNGDNTYITINGNKTEVTGGGGGGGGGVADTGNRGGPGGSAGAAGNPGGVPGITGGNGSNDNPYTNNGGDGKKGGGSGGGNGGAGAFQGNGNTYSDGSNGAPGSNATIGQIAGGGGGSGGGCTYGGFFEGSTATGGGPGAQPGAPLPYGGNGLLVITWDYT